MNISNHISKIRVWVMIRIRVKITVSVKVSVRVVRLYHHTAMNAR